MSSEESEPSVDRKSSSNDKVVRRIIAVSIPDDTMVDVLSGRLPITYRGFTVPPSAKFVGAEHRFLEMDTLVMVEDESFPPTVGVVRTYEIDSRDDVQGTDGETQ